MFGKSISRQNRILKPFLLKVKDGYLLGLAMPPEVGAPCENCALLWLRDREVWCEKAELSELKIRRDLIAELLLENSAHVYYEITNDGMVAKLEPIVFPHPDCNCEKTNYQSADNWGKKTNFAFSPITQLKVTRFGTPSGNIWLASAKGTSPLTKETFISYGAHSDKEKARFKAVEQWMKKASLSDLTTRLEKGDVLPAEVLQTGNVELISKTETRKSNLEAMGVGATKDDATLNALFQLSKTRTLKKYTMGMKNPMLVVGANNWIRTKVPFALLQQYDLHLLFYPNSTHAWVLGLAAFSRQSTSEKPLFVFSAHADINQAIDELFYRLMESLKLEDESSLMNQPLTKSNGDNRLYLWWNNWIYRCSKISLKDVLHLEGYSTTLEAWRDYFRDGQDVVTIITMNHSLLPSNLRYVVKVSAALREQNENVRNIFGMGTWADFRDALV